MTHCLKKPWDLYRNTLVRNLAWCLFSPPLLSVDDGHYPLMPRLQFADYQSWLTQLDSKPEALVEHMRQCKSPRIGLIFEHYWHFFWETQRGSCIQPPWPTQREAGQWIKNLQVNHPHTHQTIGEADFIAYQEETHDLLHYELAVKFYLGYPARQLNQEKTTESLWLGPNCIDRLDLKLNKMSSKQLQLMHNPVAKNTLPPDWQTLPIDSKMILRGQLFYPANLESFSTKEISLSDDHLKGYWYYPQDLLTSINENEEIIILDKDEWLCTPVQQHHERITSKSNLMDALQPLLIKQDEVNTKGKEKRIMTARPMILSIGHSNIAEESSVMSESQTMRQWREQRRVFVVPYHWPDTKAPSFNR